MKQWYINRTGKAFHAIAVSIIFTLSFIIFIFPYTEGNSIEEKFLLIVFMSPIILIPWLLTYPRFVIKKLVPIRIVLNDDELLLHYKKKESDKIHLERLVIAFQQGRHFNALYISKKIVATRGHMIVTEVLSIVGTSYKIGWTTKQIAELTELLRTNPKVDFDLKGKHKTLIRLLTE